MPTPRGRRSCYFDSENIDARISFGCSSSHRGYLGKAIPFPSADARGDKRSRHGRIFSAARVKAVICNEPLYASGGAIPCISSSITGISTKPDPFLARMSVFEPPRHHWATERAEIAPLRESVRLILSTGLLRFLSGAGVIEFCGFLSIFPLQWLILFNSQARFGIMDQIFWHDEWEV